MPLSVRLDADGKPIAFGKATDFRIHVRLHRMEDVVAEVEECAWTEMNRKAQAQRKNTDRDAMERIRRHQQGRLEAEKRLAQEALEAERRPDTPGWMERVRNESDMVLVVRFSPPAGRGISLAVKPGETLADARARVLNILGKHSLVLGPKDVLDADIVEAESDGYKGTPDQTWRQ